MADIPQHHIVYGTCADYVTGEILTDTDDERIRQSIFRLLVDEKGYSKEELEAIKLFDTLDFSPFIGEKKRERELCILNAFDIEVCCAGGPCVLPEAPEGR
jgi:hypothetical protein